VPGNKQSIALIAVLALGACAVAAPSAPTVMALPAQGKPFAQFQQEDFGCRNYAQQQTGGGPTAQQANNSALGSAAVGTALGAGAGAALGAIGGAAGVGAAVGGATGLLLGGAAGTSNAQAAGYSLQQRYDVAYTQCMYANGNKVTSAPSGGFAAYGPYYGPYYGWGGWGGPAVSFGFGVGGFRGGWGGWHGGGWHH
jgi:hypothetical protein